VAGMGEALRGSGALKVYVANIMTQPGETDRMDAAQHVSALMDHGAHLDVAVVNTGRLPQAALERYRREQAEPVAPNLEGMRGLGVRVVEASLWDGGEGVLRHDADTLARILVSLLLERRLRLERMPRRAVTAEPDAAPPT
jgi:uncharacterized cofD-like protein